jgi:hypothetical protein
MTLGFVFEVLDGEGEMPEGWYWSYGDSPEKHKRCHGPFPDPDSAHAAMDRRAAMDGRSGEGLVEIA